MAAAREKDIAPEEIKLPAKRLRRGGRVSVWARNALAAKAMRSFL
jgi:hypothetical protein